MYAFPATLPLAQVSDLFGSLGSLTYVWSYVLGDLVAVVVHPVDREDGALFLDRGSSSRLGRTVRGREFDVLWLRILRLRIAGRRLEVSMEESAHFGGCRVCKDESVGVAAVGLGPGEVDPGTRLVFTDSFLTPFWAFRVNGLGISIEERTAHANTLRSRISCFGARQPC